MSKHDQHNKLILEQFSKQAIPFSRKVPAHSNEAAFKLIIDTVGIDNTDTVLDVACGPGMMTCAVAQKASRVTGIDLVPAMIEQARILQAEKKLSNMSWEIGDVTQLPFADKEFSAVLTRFSFHHFLDPESVFQEMVRVAQPKGKVAVVDVIGKSTIHAKLHDQLEKWRDDSHVRVLSLEEIMGMAQRAGLVDIHCQFYRLEIELEQQLAASFPKPGDADKIRELVRNDTKEIVSYKRDNDYYLVYPIAIIAGHRP